MKKITTILSVFSLFIGISMAQTTAPMQFGPTPNARQMKYLSEPLAAFIHYGMNTYTGSDGIEWGNETKQPATTFNPTKSKVNTDQWVRLFKQAGFKRIILVIKHHDGFCTYPTQYTDYNIANSPYQGGKGDLAKELSESCDKYGMDMGIYLSPWDAHEPSYGDATPGDYNVMYDNMLRELLDGRYGRKNTETGKREIVEIWMDGASGGNNPQTYDLNKFNATVRELQPNCCVWMDAKWHFDQKGVRTNFNLDAMWVGNEAGYINDPAWNTIDLTKLKNGQQGRAAGGNIYCVSEADVSIRSGWFYHTSQDGSVKSAKQIFDNLYTRSVGMGIPLLLNIPPNRAGEFHQNDSAALVDFGKILQNTFAVNLIASDMTATATATRGAGFEAANVIDGDYTSYWTMADGQTTGSVTIDMGKDTDLDIVKIQEYIPLGQRISGFKVEVESFGNWIEFGSGQTIGYERMVKSQLVKARKIRVTITSSLAVPLICNISAYRSDPKITSAGTVPSGIENLNGSNFDTPKPKTISKLKFEIAEIESGKWPTLAEMRFYTRNAENQLIEIDRTGFTATATSEALKVVNGEPDALASNTLDGDVNTIWQPEWKPKVSMPQSLMYNFGKKIECSEISYQPRSTSQGDIAKIFNIHTAENQEDDYTLSLSRGSFLTNTTQAQFTRIAGGEWKSLTNYSPYGAALQSLTNTAKLIVPRTNGWIRIIGTKSASSGIVEVWVNGVKTETIDLYNPVTLKKQILLELPNTSADTRVEIRATGDKNEASTGSSVIIESVLTLKSGVDAMFEMVKTADTVMEGSGTYTFEVKRYGDLAKAVRITAVTTPGTGVHGKTYFDKTQTFVFAEGETVKSGSVEIVDNTFVDGAKDFYIELSQPSDNTIMGVNFSLQITVKDNDKAPDGNANLDGYCVPGGTQHSQKKAYLETASTIGAKKNFNYAVSAAPETVYVKYLESPIEAELESTFTLNLKGFKAGESTTEVFQDFRYNKAYMYADWNGDLAFSDDEKIGEAGFTSDQFSANGTNGVKANYDYTLDITKEITVPATAQVMSIPLRIVYQNAWKSYETACSDVYEGMIYDFKLTIRPKYSGVIQNSVRNFKVYIKNNNIFCEGNFDAGSKVDLIGINGKILYSTGVSSTQNSVQLPAGNLTKGAYILSIRHQSGMENYKIIK